MSIATWLLSNFTTQTPSNYKANIDGNFAVLGRTGAMFSVFDNGALANMYVQVRAGVIFNGSTLIEVAQQSPGPFVAPVGNPRIDRVVIDAASGAVSVVTGTPAASPVAPAIPANKWPIAQILLQTTSTTITNTMITDERCLIAGAATTLQTPRLINGVAFNGSADIRVVGVPIYDVGTGQTTSVYTGVTDLNTLIQAGDYNFEPTAPNKPASITSWGYLHVFRHYNTAAGLVFVHQTAYDMNGANPGVIYTRRGEPGAGYTAVWTAWVAVVTEAFGTAVNATNATNATNVISGGTVTTTSVTASAKVSGATATGIETSSAIVGVASTSGSGVYGSSNNGIGVAAYSTSGWALRGYSPSGRGIYGTSDSSIGVYCESFTGSPLLLVPQGAAPTANLTAGCISIGSTTGTLNIYIGGAWKNYGTPPNAGWVA